MAYIYNLSYLGGEFRFKANSSKKLARSHLNEHPRYVYACL
jgi:hypothetical protein